MGFWDLVATGIGTGLGAAIGTWLANKGILKHIDETLKKLTNQADKDKVT